MKRETAALGSPKPDQLTLFPALEVPLRVEIIVNRDWTRLCWLPGLAQYLPIGELLGAIPLDQPSGAWARVLDLSLASFGVLGAGAWHFGRVRLFGTLRRSGAHGARNVEGIAAPRLARALA